MTFWRLACCVLILNSCQMRHESILSEDPSCKFTRVFLPAETFSIRGMSVLSEEEVWVSGSKGRVFYSDNGGKTWQDKSPEQFKEFDFREVVATENFVCIMAAASPGLILRSTDKGVSWSEVYRNNDSLCFLDDIEFWDMKSGIAIGDPTDSLMFILFTQDSGLSWNRITDNLTPRLPVENAFAASGSNISLLSGGRGFIGLGGDKARVLSTSDYGRFWDVTNTPLLQKDAAQGIYSLYFSDEQTGVAVGGNWERIRSDSVAAYTRDGGISWQLAESAPDGYRSCVHASVMGDTTYYVSAGTSGVDISFDKGRNWKKVSRRPLNIFEFIPGTQTGYGANGKGEIFYIEFD